MNLENKFKIIFKNIKNKQKTLEVFYTSLQSKNYNDKILQISELDTKIAQFYAEGKECDELEGKIKILIKELRTTDYFKKLIQKEKDLVELWREFNRLFI